MLAADTPEKLKKCKNPDLNATKECVQAGMIAANLKQDYGAAEGLFSLACAKGDGEGCFYLGELYKNNLVKAADKSERETKISAYYKASCVLYDYLPGCLALANFMQEELGGIYNVGEADVKADENKALKYYEKSCTLGGKDGCDAVKLIKGGK